MVHYDLYKVSPEGNGEFIRGDVEEMPFSNESFDFVICVGSVLNYCDPTRCLSEISRILKPQGLLVLEYERSASAEFVWQRGFGSSACRFRTFFGSETTFIWAYSDSFVNGILALNQFVLVRSKWFHCLSALALALLRRPERAAHLMPFDGLLSKLRIATAVASNRILVAQKIPHHG
jgi:SAM-dependent methyltransferase